MFHFKKFSIDDSRCAMKIGIDSVLLGSWVKPESANTFLDIGCGCGILSIMMAQRMQKSIVTGIEIDAEAAAQAKQNVILSPWSNRIEIIHNSFQQFAPSINRQYDLIISNPPFFHNSLKSISQTRNMARHSDSLPVDKIFENLHFITHEMSKINFIIPFDLFDNWIKKAHDYKFYPQRVCWVKSLPSHPPHRVMVCFGKNKKDCDYSELCIYNAHKQYSEDYKLLTGDFYLHF